MPRLLKIGITLLSLFSSAPRISGQGNNGKATTNGTRDPQALAILQQAFEALGGKSLLSIRDTRTAVNCWDSQDVSGPATPATIITRGTSDLRVDSQTSKGIASFAITDTSAGSREPGRNADIHPRESFGEFIITHIPELILQVQLANDVETVKYVGLEPDSNRAFHHIRIQGSLDSRAGLGSLDEPVDVFIDAQTLLPAKLIYSIRAPADLATVSRVQVEYADYRSVAGILLPYIVRYSADGSFLSEQHVISFDINVGTNGETFSLR